MEKAALQWFILVKKYFKIYLIHFLVRHKKTGNLFALKQIPKSFLQDQRKFKQIMVEREVLSKLNERFLAKLITAFESEFYLNFLMEYYPGGELFFHLKKKRFSEETAKFYIAQIIFALESLHDLKIVYRDLKVKQKIIIKKTKILA